MKHKVAVTVNGRKHEHEVEPRLLLVHYLRDVVGLTGTHIGCDTSQCGACTIHVDGKAVMSSTRSSRLSGTSTDCSAVTARPDSSWPRPIFWNRTQTRPKTRSAGASK